jgi:hypothetical protein
MRRWLILAAVLAAVPVTALAQVPQRPPGFKTPPPTGQVVPPSDPSLVFRPNDFAHPMQPWDYLAPIREQRPQPSDVRPGWDGRQGAGGQVLRYLAVPAQPVIIPVPRAISEQLPLEWHQEVVTVPGYYIAETTTGYYYFERWALEESNDGVYQWRLLPAQFVRK